MNVHKTVLAVISSLLLLGCANNVRQQTAELTSAYVGAAGPSVPQFRDTRGLYSWQPLGDQALVVYTQPREAYLLSVSFCPDLGSAFGVALTSRLGWVSSGLDSVRFNNARYSCQIQQIRPIDLAKFEAMRAAQRKS